MSRILRLGDVDNIIRLRTARDGYDAADPALDPRYVTFDSAWNNSFRIIASGQASAGSLATGTTTYSSIGYPAGTRTYRRIPSPGNNSKRPVLAWQRRGPGTIQYTPAGYPASFPLPAPRAYQRAYGVCAVTLHTNEIRVSPSKAASDYVWFIFGNDGQDPEITGANGGRLGIHPLYGPGVFISRPGYNHLTTSLDNMMLSTYRNHFQFAETGIAFPDRYTGGGAFLSTSLISGDPFPARISGDVGAGGSCKIVTTVGSYPDYPPVVAYSTTTGFQMPCSIFWLSANQFIIANTPDSTKGMRWGIVATDPTYQGGVDTNPITHRIRLSNEGLRITKHNINIADAGATDYIFRSDRITPRFKAYDTIATFVGSGTYNLPSPPPAGAGIPFTFFFINDAYSSLWCGCGMVQMQDFFTSTGYMATHFRAAVISRTQFNWYKNPDYSSSIPFGRIGMMNVSDF